jgi:hypothetical protein
MQLENAITSKNLNSENKKSGMPSKSLYAKGFSCREV